MCQGSCFKNIFLWGAATLSLLSMQANALNLDSMFLAGNKKGNGIFAVSNSTEAVEYIETKILKVTVEDNVIKKIPLTRDNFALWELSVTPTKAILNPNEVKDFGVRYLCQTDCNREEDLVFQVQFAPAEAPAGTEGTAVSFRFGFAPYFVVPALDQKVAYDLTSDRENNILHINNTGNTYLKLEVSNCHVLQKDKKGCRAVYYMLSGREKDIILPDSLMSDNTKITVANYDQSIQKEHTL